MAAGWGSELELKGLGLSTREQVNDCGSQALLRVQDTSSALRKALRGKTVVNWLWYILLGIPQERVKLQ